MQLKASMNAEPNQSLDNVTEMSTLRLIRDFLTELDGFFLQNAAIFEIILDTSKLPASSDQFENVMDCPTGTLIV